MASPRLVEHASGREASGPLSERRSKTRRRLLRAAAAVFAAKSVPEATVEEILREAGISRRTFYQFFSDKIDLLAAVYASSVNHLHALRIEATVKPTTGIERLLAGFDVYLRFQAEAGPLVRVLASEALRPESPLGPMRQALIDRTVELYVERFAEVEGRPLDPMLVRALVLMSEATNLHMVTTTPVGERDIEHVRAVVHHLVRRALEPDGAG